MASNRGTAGGRTGLIMVMSVAFAAGSAFCLSLSGDTLWKPPPNSSFVIEEAVVEAEQPPVTLDEELPADAVLLATRSSPRTPHPERMALGEPSTPLAVSIASQAIPTSANSDVPIASESDEAPTGAFASSEPEVAEPLLPTPLEPATPEVSSGEIIVPSQPDEALRALVAGLRTADQERAAAVAATSQHREPPPPETPRAEPQPTAAAPLPAAEWSDPDGVNWTEPSSDGGRASTPARGGRLFGRLGERLGDSRGEQAPPGAPLGNRILDRVRERLGNPRDGDEEARPPPDDTGPDTESAPRGWPRPATLIEQLGRLADGDTSPAATWAPAALHGVNEVLATAGPHDPAAEAALLSLGERVEEGMTAADGVATPVQASQVRRAALAVARRVAVWRAAASLCGDGRQRPDDDSDATSAMARAERTTVEASVDRLLRAIERFEATRGTEAAAAVRDSLLATGAVPSAAGRGLERALQDHYLSPNVRIAVHEQFAERLLPDSTVTSGPLQDFVLGRKVRGTKTVEQSTAIRFLPHPTEIRLDLLVTGEIASRTVTEAGSVAIHSTGQSSFTVHKPITVSARGLAFAAARGSASNQSRLAGIETGFDAVPLMGPIVRGIARNQHDGNLQQASREVNAKIVSRACAEVDQQTEPQLGEAAAGIRDRFWSPMVRLGLEPTAVALETTAGVATARLRLAAGSQLAAHTPRPRAPDDALFSMQVHESSVNNACGRFGLAGRRMSLEELTRSICTQLGLPPTIPDDLPQGVTVTFAMADPLRVECRDGLVHVRITLDALEGGRRSNWYDIVAHVAYRPTITGMQVALEREGPIQLVGPGHKGRMEFGLRTIFGKMFPKERPVNLVPEKLLANPRMRGVRAVQAIVADGWLAVALGKSATDAPNPTSATARTGTGAERFFRR